MSKDDYFIELRDWSKRKLVIVKKYLDGFTRILGSRFGGDVFYVDGFAGKGSYGEGEKGSPVLAAEIAKSCVEERKRYQLYCVNVEMNPEYFEDLQKETSQFGDLVRNYPGTFTSNIDSILQFISDRPAFCFLDAFGVAGTKWSAIEKVISRAAPMDLWIRFDHKTIRRLNGSFESNAKAASKKFQHVQEMYGLDDPREIHKRLDGPSPEARIQNALDLYLDRLESAYKSNKGNGFAAGYPIYSIDGKRKYHLVFASAHQKAAILASDIVNKEEQNYQRDLIEHRENQRLQKTGQPRLFSIEPTASEIQAQKVDLLKEQMMKYFKGSEMTRSELHFAILTVENKYWFGKIRGTHITKALKDMQNNNKIELDGLPSDSNTVIRFYK